MASIRAIYILSTDNKILFSRIFPTVENRLKKRMGDPFHLYLGLFSPNNEFIGFSFGFQESEERLG